MNNRINPLLVALACLGGSLQASAQITLYEQSGLQGASYATERPSRNLMRDGLRDRAAAAVVPADQRWEVCERPGFGAPCRVLRPGTYMDVASMGLERRVASVRPLEPREFVARDRYAPAPAAVPQITFYSQEGFGGRSYSTSAQALDFRDAGFNDQASSVVVTQGLWEVCEDKQFRGRCLVLRPGQYPSLATTGMNDRISSARVIDNAASVSSERYAPAPVVGQDYRRRPSEAVFDAPVTAVRAVMGGTPERRCWVERQQVGTQSSGPNVGGAVAGAVIGGILGHQIGGGSGRDIATAGGVVAGAAIGSQVGRSSGQPTYQDVQRCDQTPAQSRVEYYDVTYTFRGVEHRVQLAQPPGSTIRVNAQGEPRA